MTKCNSLVLYHGATSVVREPLTHVGRPDLDFGPGFYLTNEREQAEKWAKTKASRRKNTTAVLNIFTFEQELFLCDTSYKTFVFLHYDVEWLNFVAASRKGNQPWKAYDWIEGGIANDSVISTIDAYVDGIMSAEIALGRLVNEELKHQICIRNQKIIDSYLSFDGYIEL